MFWVIIGIAAFVSFGTCLKNNGEIDTDKLRISAFSLIFLIGLFLFASTPWYVFFPIIFLLFIASISFEIALVIAAVLTLSIPGLFFGKQYFISIFCILWVLSIAFNLIGLVRIILKRAHSLLRR